MKIVIGKPNYVTATVENCTNGELEFVNELLTFQTKHYNGYTWQIKNHYYFNADLTFPVGLWMVVERYALKEGFAVQIEDARKSKYRSNPNVDLSYLYDYQHEAIQRAIEKTVGVVSSPVGSGKGHMISSLASKVDCKWLVLVHKDNLVQDLGERFEKLSGERAGWIRSGGRYSPERVTFGSFSTLHRNMHNSRIQEYLSKVDGLIVDECHRVAAESMSAVTQSLTNTYYRIGFSGTPFDRTDQKSIAVMAALGPCIFKIPNSVLIERGAVSKAMVKMVVCQHEDHGWRKYSNAYDALIVKSPQRKRICGDVMQAMTKPGFVFVKKKDHGVALTSLAKSYGINSVYVDGNSAQEIRQKVVESVKRGDYDLVVSTSVFYEGVDIPELRSVFNAAAGASTIEVIQKMGRGTRKINKNDTTFEMWDIHDRGQKWMAEHANKRVASYKRESADVQIANNVYDLISR
jgi:superfamily II DNA or RNA helicase